MRLTAPIPAMNGPQFDQEVRDDGGYVWWYVDALSDDGLHGLTMIAFIGSVFSPIMRGQTGLILSNIARSMWRFTALIRMVVPSAANGP